MKYSEVEFKYRADDTLLSDFTTFCESRKPLKFLVASGYDHFYENPADENRFFRYRVGPDSNQLTLKCKTTVKNNFVRDEDNVDLAKKMTRADAESFIGKFGYTYNTSIFKNCFVYQYEWYTLVYYMVYSTDLKELGRFVEIEMKETDAWTSEEQAWNELLILEKLCKTIGAMPQARIKRSLFELFKK